ncbi:hypothetical protein MB84_29875 (plasmid) [Pandoraea oxalativorans]|uniref:Helicase C-terminal domain-containing protein n=1 Tax=Pandoraea oxalativorans TaxID=573737 RepID=A0A192B153_9BURK|nr:hypothetical protein MB84_29875 [Pandoraea oxalativorans]
MVCPVLQGQLQHERQIFKEKCPAENQFFATFRFRISPVAYPLLRRDARCLCSPSGQIISKARMLLHGRLGRKARGAQLAALDALASDAPRVVLTTGRLVGEGFDHPALDTLVPAMPIAWKGTLQQYAGRLHREHAGKTGVRVLDTLTVDIRYCRECGRSASAVGHVGAPVANLIVAYL